MRIGFAFALTFIAATSGALGQSEMSYLQTVQWINQQLQELGASGRCNDKRYTITAWSSGQFNTIWQCNNDEFMTSAWASDICAAEYRWDHQRMQHMAVYWPCPGKGFESTVYISPNASSKTEKVSFGALYFQTEDSARRVVSALRHIIELESKPEVLPFEPAQ